MDTETKGDKVKLETGTLKCYSLAQAAELVGIKASRLHEMVSTGEFRPEISLGMAYIFTPNDIARLRPLARTERRKSGKESPVDGGLYSVQQLAREWGLSPDTVRKLFQDEPGVMKLEGKSKKGRKPYTILRIPQNVVERVKRRMS